MESSASSDERRGAATRLQGDSSGSSVPAISLSEWPWLLTRYVWSRPLVVRAAGAFVVGYTIVVVADGGYALVRWLFGLVSGLFGWGLIAGARRLTVGDLDAARRRLSLDAVTWIEWLFGRLSLRSAKRVQVVAGALLVAAGLALGVGSTLAL
jgi:hypothetical protein